ncbi:hypothetical protein [Paenibacillus beijingensis]|uniref:Uncharacterized protein n=1 Tax=Paenibacillus beijingensis TaxID=1126833 RepID=A0A0D5NMH3_9BACL|nr:hypothetical protein [Paenibacillus beijingensis]AJY76177.1 hypothetical protein VN24_18435 [Paenibacillus beijingensis]
MESLDAHEWVKRYTSLKKRKTELENEMNQLRSQIIEYCEQRHLTEFETGHFRVKLIYQERKEYDDQKLYEALPDPDVWRYISKADPGKISSLLKLNVLSEDQLSNTFKLKRISLLQVDKQ